MYTGVKSLTIDPVCPYPTLPPNCSLLLPWSYCLHLLWSNSLHLSWQLNINIVEYPCCMQFCSSCFLSGLLLPGLCPIIPWNISHLRHQESLCCQIPWSILTPHLLDLSITFDRVDFLLLLERLSSLMFQDTRPWIFLLPCGLLLLSLCLLLLFSLTHMVEVPQSLTFLPFLFRLDLGDYLIV